MAEDRENSARITRDNRQARAMAWAKAAFSVEEATSLHQRGLRLLEEAIELFQACVASANRAPFNMDGGRRKAHELVDFVFGRDIGEIEQELGGVSVCMLVLASAAGVSVDDAERAELECVLSKPIEEFTKRNAAKNAAGFLAVARGEAPGPVTITPEQLLNDQTYKTYTATSGDGHIIGESLAQRLGEKHQPTLYSTDPINRLECSCGAVFTGQNPDDEFASHIAVVNVKDGRHGTRLRSPARCSAWSYPGHLSWDAKLENVADGRQCALVAGHAGAHVEGYSTTFAGGMFDAKPRVREWMRPTDEEVALFAAVWRVSNPIAGHVNHDIDQLVDAAHAWDKAHPGDRRTPTEIAAGITDKNPTRIHTIKPDGSIPTLAVDAPAPANYTMPAWKEPAKAPRVMHLRRLPSSVVDLKDECLMCHKLSEDFDREDMYTYESDVYALEARKCTRVGPATEIDPPVTESEMRRAYAHIMRSNSARFEELEAIKKLVGGPHLAFVSSGASALKLVTELVEGHAHAQAMIKDYEKFAGADGVEITSLKRDLALARDACEALARATISSAPIPMFLTCPACNTRHIDVGEFATKPHHTHACQSCGLAWRPAIGPTVGVQFLPGFKNEEK